MNSLRVTGTHATGWARIVWAAVAVLVLALVFFPFAWLVVATFKPDAQFFRYPPHFLSPTYTLSQYVNVWRSIPLFSFLRNTVVFSGGVAVCSVFFDSMAGYAFARLKFKGCRVLFILVLISMMIPFQVLMIPLFIEIDKMGIYNTFLGLILPRAGSAFGVYLMRSFFVSLPRDLEEAGRVDGLSEFGIYWRIMLPLARPGMVTLAVFTLVNNWNDLLYPLMLTSSNDMRTLSAGLASFVGMRTIAYGPTLAACALALLPLLLVYLFAQRYFTEGIATTGLKG